MMKQKIESETNSMSTIGIRKRVSRGQDAWFRMQKSRSAVIGLVIIAIIVLVAVFAGVLVDYEKDCLTPDLPNKLQGPSAEHLLGTDALGRDVLARMIYGARISMIVAVCSVVLSTTLGAILGATAGFYGGKIEQVIMRFTDIFASIPSLLVSITIAAALGQSLLIMILAIGIAAVPAMTRIVRAQVLTVVGQEFVMAGKALGANSAQLIGYHLLPNCVAPMIVQCTLKVAGAILSTSSLSFLGVGIKPPTPEWGNMLSDGRLYMRQAMHMTVFPGLAIMITILAFNLMGDGLRDALDPRMKR